MNETRAIQISDPMPYVDAVAPRDAYEVVVSWRAGRREGKNDLVDLAPVILSYKAYRALRDDRELFKRVRVSGDGAAIGWGETDELDIAATTLERLAEESMSPSEFRAWLDRHGLTYDAASAQLGISRRLVAYYASHRPVPRYIALACRYFDERRATASEAQT